MAHCGVLSEEEVSEINNGTVDEATLFFAMTHNFHHQYWQTVYEKEELETNFNSEYPTPEERVVRCFLAWMTRSVHAEPQVSSKVWFGMANAVRGVALASAADRSLPVLDVGSGNGHMCHLLARAGADARLSVLSAHPFVLCTSMLRLRTHSRHGLLRGCRARC